MLVEKCLVIHGDFYAFVIRAFQNSIFFVLTGVNNFIFFHRHDRHDRHDGQRYLDNKNVEQGTRVGYT